MRRDKNSYFLLTGGVGGLDVATGKTRQQDRVCEVG